MLLSLLWWRDRLVDHLTVTGILLLLLSDLVSNPVLDLSPSVLDLSSTVLDREGSTISLGDEVGVGCGETRGHNGGPGSHDLLRVDGGVELGAREEVLEYLLNNRELGQTSDNDNVRDGALIHLGPV